MVAQLTAVAPVTPSIPRNMSAPLVHSKELQSVLLLRTRQGYSRLDLVPFCTLYVGVLVAFGVYGEWQSVRLLGYALGALLASHVMLVLFTHWNVSVSAFVTCRRARQLDAADKVKVTPSQFNGKPEIVPLELKLLREATTGNEYVEVSFEYRKRRFVYRPDSNAFEHLKFPVHEPLSSYLAATGHGSTERVASATQQWGLNKFDVPLPPFVELMKEQMLAPFFVFQVFCVGLWCLDEYWYYSLFTLMMLVVFEGTVAGSRLRNLREMRGLQAPKQRLQAYRGGRWETLPGEALLPGDVVSIGRPASGSGSDDKVVPADMLLLGGSCIAEEALLTGESTPQWKVPISDAGVDVSQRLAIKGDHKQHVLFGGTRILQHTGDKAARIRTPDGGCLAVVLRTGFETSQGQLMRTILYSTERLSANNLETGVFICFLLCFAVSAAAYVLQHGLQDPERSRFKLLLNCVMIITSVIPPELPMELTIAVNAALVALARRRIFCTEPFRIPFAGKVEVCCFDKTGTLTSDQLLLEGIAGVAPTAPRPAAEAAADANGNGNGDASGTGAKRRRGAKAGATDAQPGSAGANAGAPISGGGDDGPLLVHDLSLLPAAVGEVLACCQSLVLVDGEMIGDPLETAALQSSRWVYSNDVALSPDRRIKASILLRYHFSSSLARMSAVVRVDDDDAPAPVHVVVTKGAPEVVRGLLAEVPPEYDATYKAFAARGGRVIALARRQLPPELEGPALRQLPRETAEAGLGFVGFAVFQCPLKPESEPALAALAAGSHQLVMITGDAPLTAAYAAAQLHIVTRPVLVLQHRQGPSAIGGTTGGAVGGTAGARVAVGSAAADLEFVWLSPDESTAVPLRREWDQLLLLASQFDLAITGEALAHAEAGGFAPQLVPLVQVFARVSPEQKELVLQELRGAGRVALMCGDGTNDVGALKAAHVGVALLAPSELAARLQAERARAAELQAAMARRAAGLPPAPPRTARGATGPAGAAAAGTAAAGGAAGAAAARKSGGGKGAAKLPAGSAMLEELRKQGKPVPPRLQAMAEWLDQVEAEGSGDVALVKPGDASMAAPFTAKASSIAPVPELLKQGRCSLVTTVQMFKILGLLCLSSAYSLSVMYLQGVRLSDAQATLSGVLTAAMFFFISHAQPLEGLSRQRPYPSIFNLYFFLSLLGQFAAHLGLLAFMYQQALARMAPEEVERQLMLHKLEEQAAAAAALAGVDAAAADADASAADAAPGSVFEANLVNSVCYLVQQSVQLATFGVNYVGAPFNTPLLENRGMRMALGYTGMFLAALVVELMPWLNESFGLVPIPADLRLQLLVGTLLMVGATWSWEQLLRGVLAPPAPPPKPYMSHARDLRRLHACGAVVEGLTGATAGGIEAVGDKKAQ